jgi:hypothetical protein
MSLFRSARFAGALLAAGLLAPAAPAAAQDVKCSTVGGVTSCTDETPTRPYLGTTPAVQPDVKPPVTNLGRSGPTQYERQNLRVFGADNQIRLLGNAEQKAGQQGAPLNSGRNCATFNTSVICD